MTISDHAMTVLHWRPRLQHLPVAALTQAVKTDMDSRFLPTSPAFDAPIREFPPEYYHPVWCGKTRIVWLPDGEKIEDIFIRFETMHERDTQRERERKRETHTQTHTHDGICRAYA